MHASEAKTVLYVEDNRVNTFLVQSIFDAQPQIRLLTALLGGVGLELAKKHRPDLILLDLHLPDMDGEGFLYQLRATEALVKTPVIIVSADPPSDERSHYLKLGIADYIAKPFDLTQFERVVNRYLDLT